MQEVIAAAKSGGVARQMGLWTAMALVIASMVGTGVFVTTGFVIDHVASVGGVLLCWLLGGLAALSGALAYAELGAAMPHNGGEYHFLSRLYHPIIGFLSAWVSLIVGFAAPLAAVAAAFGIYLQVFWPSVPSRWAGAVLILALSGLHAWRVSAGAWVQNILTYTKVLLIAAFIVVGALYGDFGRLINPEPTASPAITWAGLAMGLLLVSFSYSGWNAAAYVAGEVARPARTLPAALALGTAIVTLLYVGLNLIFLSAATLPQLKGKVEVGHIAAAQLLGPLGGRVLSGLIAAGLLSTAGALVVTGSRVSEAVGRDLPRLGWLAQRSPRGGPTTAIAVQATIALAMLFEAGFEALLSFVGFTLSVFAALTVGGVFVLRRRAIQRPFNMPGYPVTPLVFLALMVWMVGYTIADRPVVALAGLGTVAVGLLVYRFVR